MNRTNKEPDNGYMRLRLTIVYRPAGYRNDLDVWINQPFDEQDFDDALNHALDAFAGEVQERMAYADLLRRGIECEFRPSQIPRISVAPDRQGSARQPTSKLDSR